MLLFIGAIIQTFQLVFFIFGCRVEIIPELIGWLLISEGIDRIYLSHETIQGNEKRLDFWLHLLMGLTGVRLFLGILGFIGYTDAAWYQSFNTILEIVPFVVSAYVWLQIIQDFEVLEQEDTIKINAENTRKAYLLFFGLKVIVLILGLLPVIPEILLKIGSLVIIAAGINFLFEIYSIYESLEKGRA